MKSNCLCDPIQGDLNILSIAESLCPDEACQNLVESIVPNIDTADDTKASCSASQKESSIYSSLTRCDYYGASYSDCVKYVNDELKRTCGGSHNCIQTGRGNYAGYSTYWHWTEKLVILSFSLNIYNIFKTFCNVRKL